MEDKTKKQKQKRKGGKTFHVHVDNELRQVFIGHHTLFSVFGFTVGGILVGEMLARYMYDIFGLGETLLIGLLIFIISAFWSQEFRG